MPRTAVSPFPKVPRQKSARQNIDVDLLSVEHSTPIPKGAQINGKYDHLFKQLKVGSCVVCEVQERENLRNALDKYIKRTGREDTLAARSVSRCEDGRSRIWLVARKA